MWCEVTVMPVSPLLPFMPALFTQQAFQSDDRTAPRSLLSIHVGQFVSDGLIRVRQVVVSGDE